MYASDILGSSWFTNLFLLVGCTMNDPDEMIRITKNGFELIRATDREEGFLCAVNALMSQDADKLHELYASGFASWLMENRARLLNERSE